ncbi:unnamed protein product, partial [Allacma fusca]
IANLQRFDGSFILDQNLASIVEIPLTKLQQVWVWTVRV